MKLAITAAAMLFAAPAAALDLQDCISLSEVAGLVMDVRQTGAPIHAVMNDLGSSLDGGELELSILLIEAAYQVPLWSTDANKARASSEFATDMFNACRGRK